MNVLNKSHVLKNMKLNLMLCSTPNTGHHKWLLIYFMSNSSCSTYLSEAKP